MLKKLFSITLLIGLFCIIKAEFSGNDPLAYVGILTIDNENIAADFASRFNAAGRALFLISDVKRGVSIGDMIRFQDKVVYINAEVWQTMKTTGVLENLGHNNIIAIEATSQSEVWASRSKMANGLEKKAYILGETFLQTMEERFENKPTSMQFSLRFDGSKMYLVASRQLLEKLVFQAGSPKIAPKLGSPQIVSVEKSMAFKGVNFSHQVWAIDLQNPGESIQYAVQSDLPDGLRWSHEQHAIIGSAKKAGMYKIKFQAKNTQGRTDLQVFTLTIRKNEDPKIFGNPESIVLKGAEWEFKPIITDPDHLINELTIEPVGTLPEGILYDKGTQTFRIQAGLTNERYKKIETECFGLSVKDPMGGFTEKKFCFDGTASLGFKSALSSNKFMVGQIASYKPVAVGPSQNLKYAVYDLKSDELLASNFNQFTLNTNNAGTVGLKFTAEDDLGNKSEQTITYKVIGTRSSWSCGGLSIQPINNSISSAYLYYRHNNMRLGCFFPDAAQNMPNLFSKIGKDPNLMDIPFFIVGFNVTGDEGGKTAFIESGLKFKSNAGIVAGGFLLRVDGQYNSYESHAVVFDYNAQYHVNQAIALFTYDDMKKNRYGNSYIDNQMADSMGTNRGITNVGDYITKARNSHPGINEMLNNYEDPDNDILLLNFGVWFKLHSLINDKLTLWAAPLYSYENHIFSAKINRHSLFAGGKIVSSLPMLKGDMHINLGLSAQENSAVKYALQGGLNILFGKATY